MSTILFRYTLTAYYACVYQIVYLKLLDVYRKLWNALDSSLAPLIE